MHSSRDRGPFSTFTFFICVLLALLLFAPAGLKAQSVDIILDNANQTTPAPTIGTTTLDFNGTVNLSIGLVSALPSLDNPVNDPNTFALVATLDPAFATFLGESGAFVTSYTGRLFSVDVPAGTPADVYEFRALGGFSQLSIEVASAGGSFAGDSAPFSVQVIPEPATLGLLALGCLGCCSFRSRRKS